MRIYSGFFRRLQHKLIFHMRLLDTKVKTNCFAVTGINSAIQRIYVINLDRKPDRWNQVSRELRRINNRSGESLFDISRRFSAIDARYLDGKIDEKVLLPYFTLADQLQVEPNPRVQVDASSKARRIEMTPQEIAIALSHIELWKLVAASNVPYTLILEDDVYFRRGFAQNLDAAWLDLMDHSPKSTFFDILFLSFQEVGISPKAKKPQTRLVRRPERGIWQASGYILSQVGARKLLGMLPVYGPVDLWLNLQFDKLEVFLTKRSIIEQRVDVPSTNSYSVMPVLSQIGVYTRAKPLVTQTQKLPGPIFAFGNPSSGLTALATALSVIGYTCCSDITELPTQENHNLITKSHECHFNAYLNIGSLISWSIDDIIKLYPNARFIFTTLDDTQRPIPHCKQMLYLPNDYKDKWEALSTFLKCEYPSSPYPTCIDIGQQTAAKNINQNERNSSYKQLKFDSSPWIVSSKNWGGITITKTGRRCPLKAKTITTWSGINRLNDAHWKFRDDTFPSNLSIFAPDNIEVNDSGITQLTLREQSTAVRQFTSAAIATRQKFLYGKFTAEIRPSNVSGLITGMFLHRNSPYQEIDIEFLGKDTKKMLVNVFYNPGSDGTKLEFGYRGTPILIDLGFDAAKEFHRYEIEWREHIICWRVDGCVVHERVLWNPTPIPNLAMEFNVNLWYSRSKELAGKLDKTRIPAQAEIKSIQIINYK